MHTEMDALGQSEAFLDFQESLSRVAPIDRPVLLIGERGTGKELAASRMHYLSRRWQGPFTALNCAALAPSLIEPELFGYEKGAFTGAVERRPGRFETADGGTLLLDEIGNIPLEVQAKILRVVEYGVFERVGSTRPVEVDVRIIGATNADLRAMAVEGHFKSDLLDRLAFDVLFLPPLRARGGDIRLLAEHFAGRMALELGRTEQPVFTADARRALEHYTWPGNIRELKNVVERAVYRTAGATVRDIVFDPFGSPDAAPPASGQPPLAPAVPDPVANGEPLAAAALPFKEAVAQLEIQLLRRAMEATRFNQKKAARRLGLTYDQFRGQMRKHKAAFA
ncbi:MAG: phage shock protein operon transcriptional activator [Desulfobacterales bacterium]|nr:phage shock protein operon transcriptional activator [Desulfobacterales bacterium]